MCPSSHNMDAPYVSRREFTVRFLFLFLFLFCNVRLQEFGFFKVQVIIYVYTHLANEHLQRGFPRADVGRLDGGDERGRAPAGGRSRLRDKDSFRERRRAHRDGDCCDGRGGCRGLPQLGRQQEVSASSVADACALAASTPSLVSTFDSTLLVSSPAPTAFGQCRHSGPTDALVNHN